MDDQPHCTGKLKNATADPTDREVGCVCKALDLLDEYGLL